MIICEIIQKIIDEIVIMQITIILIDMSQYLNIRIKLRGRQSFYKIDFELQKDSTKVKISDVLKKVNTFLMGINYSVQNYLKIEIETKDNKRQNIFKLKKKSTEITLPIGQNGKPELNIILEDVDDKSNILQTYHRNVDQYSKLIGNINNMIEKSKEEEKKRGENFMRQIDIAYIFADPLVDVNINSKKITAKNQVSYQREYDKFIDLVKNEQFSKILRIEMMVATKTNIKNVLNDGVSILHFSCHGNAKGNLQIQNESSVGEQVELEMLQFINLLDSRSVLPKLIIFNACYSEKIAKLVSQRKKILTIGYSVEIADYYCQNFTKEIYMGIYRDKTPVRQLFHKIKQDFAGRAELKDENMKVRLYPLEPLQSQNKEQFFGNKECKFNYIKKWTYSDNMRENDLLGVKEQMFRFIKQYLNQNEANQYVCLKGQKKTGKSDFMKKVRIYLMNRKIFTQDFVLDLKNSNGQYIENLLQLRLEKEYLINEKIQDLKEKFRAEKMVPLIIIDHCQKIFKIEYSNFIDFIQQKFIKWCKYCKVVFITNKDRPINKEDASRFQKACCKEKEIPNIKNKEFMTYMNRYVPNQLAKEIKDKINENSLTVNLDLVKALKISKSYQQLQKKLSTSKNIQSSHRYQKITLPIINSELSQFEALVQELIEGRTFKVEENYILSAILNSVELKKSKICCKEKTQFDCKKKYQLIPRFKHFYNKIFRNQGNQFDKYKHQIPIKRIFQLSVKIYAVEFLYKQRMFEHKHQIQQHLFNCIQLHRLVMVFYEDTIRQHKIRGQSSSQSNGKQNLYFQANRHHLRILLAIYCFYSEDHKQLQYQSKNLESEQNLKISSKKMQIIMEQISKCHYKQQSLIKNFCIVNKISQQIYYNQKKYSSQSPRRRQSEYNQYCQDVTDIKKQIDRINEEHAQVEQFWNAFLEIQSLEMNYRFDIEKQSLQLLELNAIKAVQFIKKQLQEIISRGESFITQKANFNGKIMLYIKIMEKIENDGIFSHFNKEHEKKDSIFTKYENLLSKKLYEQYLKSYIDIYFNLSKIQQDITKEYNLKIFHKLIHLCQNSQDIHRINSLKKMIESHINEQFNTWTCTTFIAIPLQFQKSKQHNRGSLCNIKRYEQHIFNFTSAFFRNQIDKQIKHEIKLLSKQNLAEYAVRNVKQCQQEQYAKYKRSLIKLIICDVNRGGQKLYLETQRAYIQPVQTRFLQMPEAPVVIYFGLNVQSMKSIYKERYRNQEKGKQHFTVLIWINIQEQYRQKISDLQKLSEIKLQIYDKQVQILNGMLQYFYCSFCRHFFNSNHKTFVEQVKNSYNQAKAQTYIQLTIKYTLKNDEILRMMNQIGNNFDQLKLAVSEKVAVMERPAYHFIYKQNKLINVPKVKPEPMQPEIGCNVQICDILDHIHNRNSDKQLNIYVHYKSQIMVNYFISTLRIKLQLCEKFIVKDEVIGNDTYRKYRQLIHNKTFEEQILVTFFKDLDECHIKNQLNQKQIINIFYSNTSYHIPFSTEIFIEENYKNNKIEYQLYYLHLKAKKSSMTEDKLQKLHIKFNKAVKQSSANLQNVKNALQK